MNSSLLDVLHHIAGHCFQDVHWERYAGHPTMIREPLEEHHLERHLDGGPGIGLAPIVPGTSVTRIALLDLDSHKGEVSWPDMVEVARQVADTLRFYGLTPSAYRSSGGRGIHLVMLWEEGQDAYSVRRHLVDVLAECGLTNGVKGVGAKQVEIFPKQDEVAADGAGNMFILPFFKEGAALDPYTFEELGDEGLELPAYSTEVLVLDRPMPIVREPAALPTDLASLTAALARIENSDEHPLDYDQWRNVIFGIHHATDGSDIGLAFAHAFSARCPGKYDPDFLDHRVWPYIKHERGGSLITADTIFAMARRNEDASSDFNGVARVPTDGRDAAPPLAAPEAAPPFSARTALEHIGATGNMAWIVDDVIPHGELTLIVGAASAGKSFLALDLAACLALGRPWFGHKVRPMRVAYVAAESAGGLGKRLEALQAHYGVDFGDRLMIYPHSPNLLERSDALKLNQSLAHEARRGGPFGVVIIDTLARVASGADENSAQEMGEVLDNLRLATRGIMSIALHHLGKDLTKGARGSTAIKAAADAEISIINAGGLRTATVTKVKDGEEGEVLQFRLQVEELGADASGKMRSSCWVRPEGDGGAPMRPAPSGKAQRRLLKAAEMLLDLQRQVSREEVVNQALESLGAPPDKSAKTNHFGTLEGLVDDGFLIESGPGMVVLGRYERIRK